MLNFDFQRPQSAHVRTGRNGLIQGQTETKEIKPFQIYVGDDWFIEKTNSNIQSWISQHRINNSNLNRKCFEKQILLKRLKSFILNSHILCTFSMILNKNKKKHTPTHKNWKNSANKMILKRKLKAQIYFLPGAKKKPFTKQIKPI